MSRNYAFFSVFILTICLLCPIVSHGQETTPLLQVTSTKSIDLYPSISFDGKKLLFQSLLVNIKGFGTKNFEIMLMDQQGKIDRLTTHDSNDSFPVWSKDQKQILFDSMRDDIQVLWIMEFQEEKTFRRFAPSQFIQTMGDINYKTGDIVYNVIEDKYKKKLLPRWDGEQWKSYRTHRMPSIWIARQDGTGAHRVIQGLSPKWSPNGKTIAFASNQDGDYNIYTMNASGEELTKLTESEAIEIEPAWSPDGEYIAYVSNANKNWDVCVMKKDGSNKIRITTNEAFDGGPSWSKDNFIYFHSDRSGNWDIWKLQPPGILLSEYVDDMDKDGIKDEVDKCPEVAEDRDGFEDEDGCPDEDNDKDGIVDAEDKCPDEPESKNDYQDEDGCPDDNPILKNQIIRGIRFEGRTAKLLPESSNILNTLAANLMKSKNVRIEIRAYTDNRGSNASKMKLTQDRADAIRNALRERGVEPWRLTARGYGDENPIGSNMTSVGRNMNNRIEIFRLDF